MAKLPCQLRHGKRSANNRFLDHVPKTNMQMSVQTTGGTISQNWASCDPLSAFELWPRNSGYAIRRECTELAAYVAQIPVNWLAR